MTIYFDQDKSGISFEEEDKGYYIKFHDNTEDWIDPVEEDDVTIHNNELIVREVYKYNLDEVKNHGFRLMIKEYAKGSGDLYNEEGESIFDTKGKLIDL